LLEEFERSQGVVFPEAYRAFLLRWNGGVPQPNAYYIRGFAGNPEGFLQVFYGIGYPIEACSLEWAFQMLRDEMPDNLLPIAGTCGPDRVCLCWYGDRAGQVYYWDGCNKPDPPDFSNIYFIAESFRALLDSLHEFIPPAQDGL
jgi:hypothetical protein